MASERGAMSAASARLVVALGLTILGVLAPLGPARATAGAPHTYVVTLRADADVEASASALARAHGGEVGFLYRHALRGFSVRLPTPQAAAAIARHPAVERVEADQEFAVAVQYMPTGIARVFAPSNESLDIDGADDARVDVDVAVIDTGIDLDHVDLNVVGSTNCATFFATCGAGGDDGNGHGTHVAGTIGALDNDRGVVGIAPGARLWSVRVLGNNGTGSTSQIVAGMDWVTARASTIEVANLSISGGASSTVDSAANRMADAGIAVAVAAGNNDADAMAYSPARAAKVLTVSAIADYDGLPGGLAQPPSSFCLDEDDTLANFSNWGAAIEIAAPGCRIHSTYLNSGYAFINGTSMASPHVAGALGLLASRGFARTYAGVSGLYGTVLGAGNRDWTDESGDGAQEPLLDVSNAVTFDPAFVGEAPPPPPNEPPVASFTYSCTSLTCSFDGTASSDTDGSIAAYGWSFGDGATGSGSTTSRTYSASGSYTVTLTVTDDDGATATSSAVVSVTSPAAGYVVSLSGSSAPSGSRWSATVVISVTANGAGAQGISVTGAWTNGASGNSSCTTGASGQCTVSKLRIAKSVSSVRFTVSSVAGGTTFSGATSITVAKP